MVNDVTDRMLLLVNDVTSRMPAVTTDQPESRPPPPLRVWWRAEDPAAVTALLERLGLEVFEGSVALGPIVLSVAPTEAETPDRLEIGDAVAEPVGVSEPNGARLAALGWATVDAERLAVTLGKALTGEGHAEPALGAIGFRVESAWLPLVLLEPATEGRLAATLARLGEGPVALYLEGIEPGDGATPLGHTGTGREGRLLRPGRPSGPFIVALQP